MTISFKESQLLCKEGVCFRLSVRELKAAQLVAEGLRNRAIAERLGTSEQVVKNLLLQVFRKGGFKNRVELANRMNEA